MLLKVRRFLGVVNYMYSSRITENYASLTEPLRR